MAPDLERSLGVRKKEERRDLKHDIKLYGLGIGKKNSILSGIFKRMAVATNLYKYRYIVLNIVLMIFKVSLVLNIVLRYLKLTEGI